MGDKIKSLLVIILRILGLFVFFWLIEVDKVCIVEQNLFDTLWTCDFGNKAGMNAIVVIFFLRELQLLRSVLKKPIRS